MSKRIIALLLACMMTVGLLSSCGSEPTTTDTNTNTDANTDTTTDPNAGGDTAGSDAPAANDPKQTIMFAHWYACLLYTSHPVCARLNREKLGNCWKTHGNWNR